LAGATAAVAAAAVTFRAVGVAAAVVVERIASAARTKEHRPTWKAARFIGPPAGVGLRGLLDERSPSQDR
jgi:hypothetical protein